MTQRAVLYAGVAALLGAAMAGCVAYRPLPLAPDRVAGSLAVPTPDTLAVRAARLHRPLLPPVTLDARDGLTPDEAALVAVLVNPELAARRAARGVVAAQLFAEGLLPLPLLDASADVPLAGEKGAQTAWSLGLMFDLQPFVTRGARRAAARAIRDSTDLGLAYAEWQVAQQARRAAYRVLLLEKQRLVVADEVEALGASLAVLDDAERRRLVTEVDRAAAEAAFRDARLVRLGLDEEEADARLALAGALGVAPGTPVAVQPVALPVFQVPPLDTLVAGLDTLRLDLRALRLGYASAEAGLRAAILKQFPALTLGGTLARSDAGLLTLGPALGVTFPFFALGSALAGGGNRGEIAVATATRAQLFAEYAARHREAETALAQAASLLEFARQRVTLAAEAYATRRHLVEIYGQALQYGQADVLTYYNARVEAVGVALQALQAEAAAVEAGLALETLAGRPFAAPPGPPLPENPIAPLPPPFRAHHETP